MRAYSADLRIRVLKAYESGLTAREVSAQYGVSERVIYRWKKLKQSEGIVAPKRQGGYRKPLLFSYDEKLKAIIKSRPDITLEELQLLLLVDGCKAGISTLWRTLDRLGLSYKKNTTRCGAGQARRKRAAQRVVKTSEKP